MYVLLLTATGTVIIVATAVAYLRSKDSFHPLVLIGPMFLFLYVLLPLKLLYTDDLDDFLRKDQLVFAQLITLFGVLAFCVGCLVASWKREAKRPSRSHIPPSTQRKLFIAAAVLGTVGVAGYLAGIVNVGGFWEAYGKAYGGGLSETGYVREAPSLCIPAIIFIFISRTGRRLNAVEWASVGVFAIPFVIQGVLGARRAPTFLIVTAIGVGWYMMRNRRPSIPALLAGGLAVGFLLLLLATNRSSIFLGATWNIDNNPLEYTKAGTGNEYIYGAGIINHFSMTEDYYWGRRYFAVLFIRPIPRQLWPTKYQDVGVPQIELNLGSGVEELNETLGWEGALGAAGGIVADMWIEFSWLSLVIMFLLGVFYGYCWRMAMLKGRFAMVIYILTAALTLFLVTQTLEAMMVRFLFMSIPAWLVWRWAMVPSKKRSLLFQGRIAPSSIGVGDLAVGLHRGSPNSTN